MANIFTRKAVSAIVTDENLTPEERAERIFSLYGQALDDGYVAKGQHTAALNSAIEQAKADALKDYKAPDVKESEEYKALVQQMEDQKARFAARDSEDFKNVKPKFFDTVYGMIDRAEGAKPIADQLTEISGKYEEYFLAGEKTDPQPAPAFPKPTFGAETKGSAPSGKQPESFGDFWGFTPKK